MIIKIVVEDRVSKIKVMHLLQSNEFSGAENVVCEIIDMYKEEDNYEMIYCSPSGHISEILKERKVSYYPLKKMSLIEIYKVVNEYKPNIIHAHDAMACVMATFFMCNAEIVAQIHGNHVNMRRFGAKSFLVRICSTFWKKIIWVSQSAFDDYYYKEKVKKISTIIPNIISKRNIENKKLSDEKIYNYDGIFLGRINSIKNPLRALKIIKSVCLVRPQSSFVFVGKGELFEECQKYIYNNGLVDNVDFVGFMDNPIKILSCSKILLMTSLYEGTPMCAIEAMGCGVPIISTPTDGIIELVEQNCTGYYSEQDSELVSKILELLDDDELYSWMKKNSYERFDAMMDVQSYKNKLRGIYEL